MKPFNYKMIFPTVFIVLSISQLTVATAELNQQKVLTLSKFQNKSDEDNSDRFLSGVDRIVYHASAQLNKLNLTSASIDINIQRRDQISFQNLCSISTLDTCHASCNSSCCCEETDKPGTYKITINITAETVYSEAFIIGELNIIGKKYYSKIRMFPKIYESLAYKLTLFPYNGTSIFNCTDGLVSDVDSVIFYSQVKISPARLLSPIVFYSILKQEDDNFQHHCFIFIASECDTVNNEKCQCTSTDSPELYNISINIPADVFHSRALIKGKLFHGLNNVESEIRHLPPIYDPTLAPSVSLSINDMEMNFSRCELKAENKVAAIVFKCSDQTHSPCSIWVTDTKTDKILKSGNYIFTYKLKVDEAMMLAFKYSICGAKETEKAISCALYPDMDPKEENVNMVYIIVIIILVVIILILIICIIFIFRNEIKRLSSRPMQEFLRLRNDSTETPNSLDEELRPESTETPHSLPDEINKPNILLSQRID